MGNKGHPGARAFSLSLIFLNAKIVVKYSQRGVFEASVRQSKNNKDYSYNANNARAIKHYIKSTGMLIQLIDIDRV